MPWNETNIMNERIKFIARYLEGNDSFTELCVGFGISRKTGYKWIDRYQIGGVEALVDYSRVPKSHPNAVPELVVQEILRARKRHPHWGPRKLLVILRRQNPGLLLPVASTTGNILKKYGLVKKRKRIRRSVPYEDRLGNYNAPNAVWCADFKGPFPVDGERCHPLTISDGFSRYLLKCKAMRRSLFNPTRKVFESTFKEFGLPVAIRTDNGAPFSTLAPGGLSCLAVWWIRLGIRPERIQPGHPEQNGRHERMHSTLKSETAKPPRFSFRSQQKSFDAFRDEYNNIRPHEALHQNVPATFYQPSSRPYPKTLPELVYPSHFHIVRAYPNGMISFLATQWYVSACLKGELIGLEEVNNDRWKVYFGPIPLGILDPQYAKDCRNRHFGTLIRWDGEIHLHEQKQYKKVLPMCPV